MQKKETFRSQSNLLKAYEQKNPEELPLIRTKISKSSNNLSQNHILSMIVDLKKRTMSNPKIQTTVRIKRLIK